MAGEIAILGWGSLLWTGDFTTPDEENRQREFDRWHAEWPTAVADNRILAYFGHAQRCPDPCDRCRQSGFGSSIMVHEFEGEDQ